MKNKLLLLVIALILVLACGVPAESLTPVVPTKTPTKETVPTVTDVPTPLPTQEADYIVGSWNVRAEPGRGAYPLAVVENISVTVLYRSGNGWVMIEYECDDKVCYGWVNGKALDERSRLL